MHKGDGFRRNTMLVSDFCAFYWILKFYNMIISIILKLAISYQIFKELILLQWFAVKIFPQHPSQKSRNGKWKTKTWKKLSQKRGFSVDYERIFFVVITERDFLSCFPYNSTKNLRWRWQRIFLCNLHWNSSFMFFNCKRIVFKPIEKVSAFTFTSA